MVAQVGIYQWGDFPLGPPQDRVWTHFWLSFWEESEGGSWSWRHCLMSDNTQDNSPQVKSFQVKLLIVASMRHLGVEPGSCTRIRWVHAVCDWWSEFVSRLHSWQLWIDSLISDPWFFQSWKRLNNTQHVDCGIRDFPVWKAKDEFSSPSLTPSSRWPHLFSDLFSRETGTAGKKVIQNWHPQKTARCWIQSNGWVEQFQSLVWAL